MRNGKFGFSLIELMVVIGIVAVLTAIATPYYQTYVVKSRVATALTLMQYYAHLGEEYYEAHGQFGTVQQLGLQYGTQTYNFPNPESINPYTSSQEINTYPSLNNCLNEINFSFDPAALGIASGFDIQMVVRNVDNQFVVTCGIPWYETSTTYASVLKYFPDNCQSQNVFSC